MRVSQTRIRMGRWVVVFATAGVVLAAAVLWLLLAVGPLAPEEKGPSAEALRVRQMVLNLPEGVERFMITDINNAGATAPSRDWMLQSDLEDPEVRARVERAVQEVWEIEERNARTLRETPPPAPPIQNGYTIHAESGLAARSPQGTESYAHEVENRFLEVKLSPLSTFSIDVDTASYANVRRFILDGSLPPVGAVRIEELINYFAYPYNGPVGQVPFATHLDVADCPWQPGNVLARIALKGKELDERERPSANLVFLIDVSGSMASEDKLPLVKRSLGLVVKQLRADDRMAIVVYAGSSGLALPSTPGNLTGAILDALEGLESGGSTNGGEGIHLAYRIAAENFVEGGINRVILATDGDFNVGVTDQSELFRLIEEKRDTGVFLTTLGFGTGNLKDSTLEQLANRGNGTYAYIDSIREARKVFVKELTGSLAVIAKDVKIQVEFNPIKVESYRLIGYENRKLAAEDFKDDAVDAGEIGAGHTVTALYEIVPTGGTRDSETLRYQDERPTGPAHSGEWFTVKLRYKEPEGSESRELVFPCAPPVLAFSKAPEDFQFAASVGAFGMLLRDSPHCASADYEDVLEWAGPHHGEGERGEFLELVRRAGSLSGAS